MASDNDEQVDIRLQVTHDEYVSGLIERAVDGIGTTESVDGALGNSQFHLVITAPDGSERLARWWYDNRGIELDDGTFVPFVGCDGEDSQ
ncbi:MAG: hypothetical protein HKN24_05610 [Acidimicrobiales bacterium]|nr:hypothetical protein [Acidimicrobiales bacterium]